MSLLPQYRHIINPKLKHIYLSFDESGGLVIKSPKVSLRKIEQILLKKSDWIEKSRHKLDQKKGKRLDFLDTLNVYFLGMMYPLVLQKHSKMKRQLDFNKKQFTLLYHDYDEISFQEQVNHFYRIEAKKLVPLWVDNWARKMNLLPSDIRFRKTKRQWGSCSGKNVLSFNTMMMKLPKDVIQYIIVHELAHIKHKHHQKSFWNEVEMYLPDYRLQMQELKKYTT